MQILGGVYKIAEEASTSEDAVGKSLFVETMQTRERLMKHPTCWKLALFASFSAVVSVLRGIQLVRTSSCHYGC